MKAYIGPYTTWYISPYRFGDFLQKIGFSEVRSEYLVEKYLLDSWVMDIINYPSIFFKRKIKVKIHGYDDWNLDQTLAIVIYPALVKFKEKHTGFVRLDKEDVTWKEYPVNDDSDNSHKQFEQTYVEALDKMIYSFEQISKEYPDEPRGYAQEYTDYHNKIKQGLFLFGKYYQSLWT